MRELAVSQMKLSIPDKKNYNNENFKKWKTFPVWVFLIQQDAFKTFTWVSDLFGWYFPL